MTIIEISAREDGFHDLQSQSGRTSCWEDGYIEVPAHLESSAWDSMGYCDLTIEDGILTGITPTERPPAPPEPVEYIPTPEQSTVVMMRSAFAAQVPDMDDDQIIQVSGLADDWVPGNHKIGDVFNTRNGVHADGEQWDQTWEAFADYNNATFPDIKPGNSSWYTFNRPLHGNTPETARPWTKPQNGTTDIYHVGECMVYTDGKTYRCKRDTDFSPEEYAADWEVITGE